MPESLEQAAVAATGDFQARSVFEHDSAGAAGQRNNLGNGVQLDECGSGDAEKAGGIEALFEIVEGGIHPVLAVPGDQRGQATFRSEVEYLRFGYYEVMRPAAHQEPRRCSAAAERIAEFHLTACGRWQASDSVQGIGETGAGDRLEQVIDGMQFESFDGVLIVGGAKGMRTQTVPGSAVTLEGSVELGLNYGYGYQMVRWSAASLWVEFDQTFAGINRATSGIPATANLSLATFTLGTRFMVPVQSRVSLYGVGGGGGGPFHVAVIRGSANPTLSSTETWHGVFEFGGGIDFRLTRLFSVRAELRDYVTGQGLSGATGRHHPLPLAGLAMHF